MAMSPSITGVRGQLRSFRIAWSAGAGVIFLRLYLLNERRELLALAVDIGRTCGRCPESFTHHLSYGLLSSH